MKIDEIKRIPTGDTQFKVSFMVGGHNLETPELPNSTEPLAVKESVKSVYLAWQEAKAESNLVKIDSMLSKLTEI